MSVQRAKIADELTRRLAGSLRASQLYSGDHPLVARSLAALLDGLMLAHAAAPTVTIGVVGDELVVGDTPVPRAAETMRELMRRLQQAGVERIAIDREVQPDEVARLVRALAHADKGNAAAALGSLPHVRIGRLQVEQRVEAPPDIATFRKLYDDAVIAAGRLWDGAKIEGQPDADAARTMVDALAQAVAQNRTALLALTALKNYDNYTFTHMVNVSILTMGQARSLGIEGGLLREFGLAALMHDIGKVRTPVDILNKPDKLTDAEFEILKRHTVDGAAILRKTPAMPALAPVVAFEHHLRADGTGYPSGVARPRLNLCTMLCAIADVYDAMRSQRIYQQAFASERILAVLQRNDGRQFDQHLVRRFSQLVGIYPPGNLVRLDTGEVAVVVRTHAPDPHRPRVKVLRRADGSTLDRPYEIDLWTSQPGRAWAVKAPLDPGAHGIDPLAHL